MNMPVFYYSCKEFKYGIGCIDQYAKEIPERKKKIKQ